MNRKPVHVRASLVERAMTEAEKTAMPVSDHFEYYYQLGVLAEQYEDLPISMIKSLMESTKEEANLVFIPR